METTSVLFVFCHAFNENCCRQGTTIDTGLYDMVVAYGSPLDQVATYVLVRNSQTGVCKQFNSGKAFWVRLKVFAWEQ